MENTADVLMVGSRVHVKGGMSTVVKSYLDYPFTPSIKITYIASHSEKGKIYNSFFFAKSLLNILYRLIITRPTIVHLHMSDKGSFFRKYIIYKVAKLFKRKVIIHAHGGDFKGFYLRMPLIIKWLINSMLKNTDVVIALGNKWKETLLEIEPKANVLILMNSVPMPVYKEKKTDSQFFRILFLAVLTDRKGILDLIQASIPVVSKMKEQNKTILFEIAGDGELMEKAKELVTTHRLTEYYRFHGWIEEKEREELLRNSDLFVLPSYHEGLPMSILEAISYGLPVVSTNVGSVDEAVINGQNGYMIEPGDVHSLSERMLDALNNPSLKEMGNYSRKLAERKFSDEQYFKQVEALYLQ